MTEVHEIKLHGRGGQGIVTAGELLARAAVIEGAYAQSIPSFGAERRGGPSTSSLRISGEPILLKCDTKRPATVGVFDPTIWRFVNVLAGAGDGVQLLFNTPRTPAEIEQELLAGALPYKLTLGRYAIHTVDATGIAIKHLGRPITNTAMMGALSTATGVVKMASVLAVIRERFPKAQAQNVAACEACVAGLRTLQRGDGWIH